MLLRNAIDKMVTILFDEHKNYNFYNTKGYESHGLKTNIVKKKQRKQKLCEF